MKKNRDKTWSNLHAADYKLQKSSSKNVPVFLVLALIILTVHIVSIQPSFVNEDITTGANSAEVYLWSEGSTERSDGLYFFTHQQLAENFSELQPFIPKTSARPNSSPVVTAVQYSSDVPQHIDLSPEVANIFFQPIPINRADKNILRSLPGIGQVLAERIVQRREEYGPFMSKDELLRVSGIGPKKFARLVDNITLD